MEDDIACLINNYNYKGTVVNVTRGDYSPIMRRVVTNLQLAQVILASCSSSTW